MSLELTVFVVGFRATVWTGPENFSSNTFILDVSTAAELCLDVAIVELYSLVAVVHAVLGPFYEYRDAIRFTGTPQVVRPRESEHLKMVDS